MDLLDRYLQAVKFWLPKDQQDDILAELAEDIRSQIEEKESELGHKLNRTETEALLKKRGRPMFVAMRYRPQRHLIGPSLFPMYWFVLKIGLLCCLIPQLVLSVLMLVSRHPVGAVIGSLWGSLWVAVAFEFSIVTIVFAVLERYQTTSGYLENWNPGALPPVRPVQDPHRILRPASVVEIVVTTIFLAWWIKLWEVFPSAWGLERTGIQWTWGPVWQDFHHRFFFPVIVLGLASVGLSSVNLLRPYWTRPRLAIRAALHACLGLIAYAVVSTHWPQMKTQWMLMPVPHIPMGQPQAISHWTDMTIFLMLVITLIASSVDCLVDLGKIVRWKNGRANINVGAATL